MSGAAKLPRVRSASADQHRVSSPDTRRTPVAGSRFQKLDRTARLSQWHNFRAHRLTVLLP